MKDKIHALLAAKFPGVRKDGLARLAQALSLQVADETEAGALVDKLTTDKVNEFVTDYRKDVDKEVSDGNKTFENGLKKKYDLVEKKGGEPNDPKPEPTEIAAIVAAEIAKAVAPLQQKLAGYEGAQISKTRLQSLESKLSNVPEAFKAQKLKDFGRMNFETDEAFNEYLTETETDIAALNQEIANKGLAGQQRPFLGSAGKTEEDSFINSMKAINEEVKP